jgi:hypothetical protein
MFGAIRQPNGKYTIVEHSFGRFSPKTFHVKDKLKALGGVWNPQTKRWEDIDEVNLPSIPAEKRLKVRLKYHPSVHLSPDSNRDRRVYPSDIKDNRVSELTMGDDHEWVEIEEIYGEG